MSDELIRQDAVTIVARLKSGEVTPHDLLDALEQRIAAVDGAVNALPTRCFERARQHAGRLMQQPVGQRGQLAGMPIPIKDLVDVAGGRSTQGSPIYANHIPEQSDVLVEDGTAQTPLFLKVSLGTQISSLTVASDVDAVPEPSTLLLVGGAVAGLVSMRSRRRR